MPITISLVEDHVPTCRSIEGYLNLQSGIRHISTYTSAETAIASISHDNPQVALVDINLPGMNGIECVSQLKRKLPALQILMLTTYAESDLIFRSLRAGACGYLLKKRIATELAQAIQDVHEGGAPMSMPIARKVVEHFQMQNSDEAEEALSAREQEILELLANGCYYKEIGTRLDIAFSTVKKHVEHIYKKLHVQTRTEAAKKFWKKDT